MCVLPKANIGRVFCAAALAALLLVNAGDRALSDTACLNAATGLDQSQIEAFLADPTELLERYPAGGPAMSAQVQRLAASDKSTVHALIKLTENAKPIHVVSLSMGLGRAATRCAAKRPDITQAIKQLVASMGSSSLKALFSSEATVSDLALRAPPGVGTAATAGEALPQADKQPGAPSTETLNAIVKSRPPSVFLPANFGLPPGTESETRPVTPSRSGVDTPPTGGASSSSPPAETSSDAAAVLPPFSSGSAPFALFGTSEGANPPSDSSDGLPSSLTAAQSLGRAGNLPSSSDDSFRASSEGGYNGNKELISPAH